MGWTAPRTWADPEVPDAAMMNAHIRDNLLVIGQHQFAYKNATTTRNSTSTLADDPDLVLPVGTSQTWEWEARVLFTCQSAPAFKYTWAVPSGTTGIFAVKSAQDNDSPSDVFQTHNGSYGAVKSIAPGAGTWADSGLFWGILVTSATAGNLSFQWAQQTSDAGNTSIFIYSWLSMRRIV